MAVLLLALALLDACSQAAIQRIEEQSAADGTNVPPPNIAGGRRGGGQ
jgi:hypothetical protein